MFEIKDNQIIYTLPDKDSLEPVNPYLFIERLTDEIRKIWPYLELKTVFARRRNFNHKIYCCLPDSFASQQVKLIRMQLELIANNLLLELKAKIHLAGLAS
jgi:hypothetical protein